MDIIKIGKFIAENRKKKNMTQEQLAEKLGVTSKTISRWENGNYMPDISLLKPISEELGVTINELLSGERIESENYINKLEENMLNTIEYSKEQKEDKDKKLGVILLVIGFLVTFAAASIFPSQSSWSSIYSIVGAIASVIGFSQLIKKLEYYKKILLNLAFFIAIITVLFTLDFVNVTNNHQPPRFSIETTTGEARNGNKMIIYNAPFYNVYRINANSKNEYYIVDTKNKYDEYTIPISPFNRNKSGIENILKYENKYLGKNSNTGNLISHLPLAEYGYVFELDTNNLGITIDYHITDWYINENLYLEKSLLYNSISIFSLIDNVEYIKYNFSGNSYKIERKAVEENYPNYVEIKKDNKINIDNFNKYVENKMNDIDFIKESFGKIFI